MIIKGNEIRAVWKTLEDLKSQSLYGVIWSCCGRMRVVCVFKRICPLGHSSHRSSVQASSYCCRILYKFHKVIYLLTTKIWWLAASLWCGHFYIWCMSKMLLSWNTVNLPFVKTPLYMLQSYIYIRVCIYISLSFILFSNLSVYLKLCTFLYMHVSCVWNAPSHVPDENEKDMCLSLTFVN